MNKGKENEYPFIPTTGHTPLVEIEKLPREFVLMQNGSNYPHFVKEEMIDTSNFIPKATALCGRESKQPCTDDDYRPSISYTCLDCLDKLNTILESYLYDSEEEVYYHPTGKF